MRPGDDPALALAAPQPGIVRDALRDLLALDAAGAAPPLRFKGAELVDVFGARPAEDVAQDAVRFLVSYSGFVPPPPTAQRLYEACIVAIRAATSRLAAAVVDALGGDDETIEAVFHGLANRGFVGAEVPGAETLVAALVQAHGAPSEGVRDALARWEHPTQGRWVFEQLLS